MTFTFRDLLPPAKSATEVLVAALGRRHSVTVGELAEAAGVSKFTASRAAAALVEQELLLRDGYGDHSVNGAHPLVPTLRELAWRFNGVRPGGSGDDGRVAKSFDDYFYRERIPESLRLPPDPDERLDALVGPDLVTARDAVTALQRLCGQLYAFEGDSQMVFSAWRNERHRDLIHQVLAFGSATREAASTLEESAGPTAQGSADPRTIGISGRAWVRAAYLVSADARDVHRVFNLLTTAVDRAGRIHELRENALRELRTINYGTGGELPEDRVRVALRFAAEADRAQEQDAAAKTGRYMFIGGTPDLVDVGTAGDQLVAVRLNRTLEQLTAVVARMAGEECVAQWQQLHPQESERYLLMTNDPFPCVDPRCEDQAPHPRHRRGRRQDPFVP